MQRRSEICIVQTQCETGNVIWQALNGLQVSDSHGHTSLLLRSHACVPALQAALPTKARYTHFLLHILSQTTALSTLGSFKHTANIFDESSEVRES